MEAVALDPASRARTLFDILNEPDVRGMRWEAYTNASGYAMPGAADIYHQMLDIGHSINPGAAYIVCASTPEEKFSCCLASKV